MLGIGTSRVNPALVMQLGPEGLKGLLPALRRSMNGPFHAKN